MSGIAFFVQEGSLHQYVKIMQDQVHDCMQVLKFSSNLLLKSR